jgi:hypothetical protein
LLRQIVKKSNIQQMVVDGIQAFGALRMTTTHFVFATIGVGEITGTTRHDGLNAIVMTI